MPSFSHEREMRTLHRCQVIAGIDEAGRGPLAGPVYAAAVIIPPSHNPEWISSLDDSKKLSERKREELSERIKGDSALTWCISMATVEEIDEINILQATYLAMARAAQGLRTPPEFCLIDGRSVPDFLFPSTGLVKGDGKSYSIAAASILAKVARDKRMLEIAQAYPAYHFQKHKGYGTKLHLEAIDKHGVCPHHRKSFRPIRERL